MHTITVTDKTLTYVNFHFLKIWGMFRYRGHRREVDLRWYSITNKKIGVLYLNTSFLKNWIYISIKILGKELLKRTIFQFVTTPDFSTKNNELFFFFNQMFLKDGCSHDSGEVQSQGSVLCIVLMTRENKSWHQVPQKAVIKPVPLQMDRKFWILKPVHGRKAQTNQS